MRPTVILVHGLRTSRTMWRQQLEALEREGVPAVAIDLPGHGERIGEQFTLDGALATIDDAVTRAAASGSAPYLVGFSLGGYLSIEWAGRNPGRIAGLLASACGAVLVRAVMHVWRVLAAGIGRLPDRGRWLNDTAVKLFVPEPGATDVIAGGVALDVMDDAIRALLEVRPIENLRRIDEPVLFVNGYWDHLRAHARRYLAATAHGRLVTVPGSSHLVPVVQPDAFTKALLEGYREACT